MKSSFILNIAIVFISFSIYGNEYQVNTESGITSGFVKNKVVNWDDIPYAQPPVGDLRWKAPKKLDSSNHQNIINPQDNNFCVQEPSGLGGSDGDGFFTGKIRKQFPLWLETTFFQNLVKSYSPCKIQHGGLGAFYIKLRVKE